MVLIWLGMLLTACDFKKPQYPTHERPTLYNTISSDGKLVATLERIGTAAPRLRIKWLDKDEPWQELPAPKFTNSIRFGLKGYELLMTHDLPDNLSMAQLTRWDVSDLNKESQTIYQAPYLAFPVEVKPGEILVRTCEPKGDGGQDRCQRGPGSYWILVKPGHEPIRVTPKGVLLVFDQPNVTDKGFFWVYRKPADPDPNPKYPELLAYSLPRGEAPRFDVTRVGANESVQCDRAVQRCLRIFVKGMHTIDSPHYRKFIYAPEILYGAQSCKIEGLSGYFDERSVTPDGLTAVMALAPTADQPRHVVVMRFKPGQCEPTSIQHIPFEPTEVAVDKTNAAPKSAWLTRGLYWVGVCLVVTAAFYTNLASGICFLISAVFLISAPVVQGMLGIGDSLPKIGLLFLLIGLLPVLMRRVASMRMTYNRYVLLCLCVLPALVLLALILR